MKSFTIFSPHLRINRSKRWLWLMTCFTILLGGINSYSQVHTSTVGTGSGSNGSQAFPCPIGNYYWGTKNQFLVTAGELASGNMGVNAEISSVGFNVVNMNEVPTLENYVVKIYAVSSSNPLASNWYSGTPVAQATVGNFTPTAGWNQLELDTTYEWDGTSHLIIETCSHNSAWINNGNASVEWTSTLSGATWTRWYNADSSFQCSNSDTSDTSTTTRPNIRFEWTGDLPTCLTPSDLNVDGLTFNSADLSWTSTGTLFDVEYGETGFTPTGAPSTGYAGITATSVTVTGLTPETHYQYYVRQDCGTGQSLWAGPFSFFTGYCIPTSTWDDTSNRILGFSTADGYTNILNENNGTANAYSNYSNMAVTQSPGGTFYYNISVPSWTYVEVWIDFDQNLIFDETMELLAAFEYAESNTTFTGSVLIPAGTPYGDYRMRIRSRAEWNTVASPCGEISYTEAEDYTISVVDVPTCTPPSGLAVDGLDFNSADLSWTSAGTLFDVEYGETGFTPTGTPSTGYGGITNSYVTLTGLTAETHYQYYVRQDCGSGDTSLWAGPFSFFTGYCIPTSTWNGPWNRITGFSTTDGYTNISNENNGVANAYSNFSNLSVTQSPGGTFNYSISVPSWTYVEVWIDFDQNFIFDETMELLAAFQYSEFDTTFTGSVLIPAGTPYGDYRMRIRSREEWNTTASPCGEISYTEAEDYTISVVPLPTCIPPSGLAIDGTTFTTADISWISTGNLFDVEYGETGFTPTGIPSVGYEGITTASTTLTGLTAETHYQYYVRQDCGSGDTSLWAGPFSFYTGYCIPTSTWDDTSNRITGFSTTNGYTNILNENNGTSNAYSNFSYMSVSQSPGGSFDFNISVPSWTYVEVWVDLDQNMIFDEAMEILVSFEYSESPTTFTGSMLIPAGTPYGDYRMRIRSRSDWNTVASPCGEISYTEAEDYTISVVDVPTCTPPSGLAVDGLDFNSADLSWTSAGTLFDVEYGETGFTPTGTPSTGYGGITNSYVTLTGLTAETHYQYYVRQDCGSGDTSLWAGPFSFFTGYCIPTSTWNGPWNRITGFSTTDGYTNISNENNGVANAYSNFSNLSVTQSPGGTFNYSISVPSWTYVEVWIDFDQNLIFDETMELLAAFQYSEFDTTFTGSVLIPAGTPYGDYRMRIRSREEWNTTASPCGEISYTEAEDYTISVVPPPTCVPPAGLTVNGVSFTSADVSWTSTGTLFDVEFGTSGFTPTGIPTTGYAGITTTSTTLTGLTAETNYQYYVRQDCGDGDTSIWVGPFAFYTGYCVVTTSNTGDYIDAFSTTGATQNVNYTEAAYPGAYVNQATQIIEQAASESFDFSSSYVGGNHIVNIWIDWNNDMIFDNSAGSTEKVYSEHMTGAVQNGTINIPAGTSSGDYRMRVRSQYSFMAGDADPAPCGNVAWGSTVDFTLSVTSTDPCAGITAPTGDVAQSLTLGDTLTDLDVTGVDLVWYSDEDLTTAISDTTVAVNGTTYYVVSETDDCQSDALAITVTVIDPCAGVVTPTGATEQSLLLGQTIAGLNVSGTNLVWYADANLTTVIPTTTPAVNGTTYYVVSETGDCQSDALAITVTVIDPCAEITTPTGDAVQIVAEGTTLAELEVDGDNLAWYADADLTQSLPATTVVQSGVIYYVASVTDICQSEPLAITVVIEGTNPCQDVTVPAPTGEAAQTLNEGQTLADLIVEGENLQWYADEDLTEPLEETHVAEDQATYYVTQTIGVCTGEALAVTVDVTLGRTDFENFAFRFYPNPVGEVLNLTSNVEISTIDLFNMLGQKVTVVANANNTQVDMSGLPTGNYIMSVTIEGVTKTFKVVKK